MSGMAGLQKRKKCGGPHFSMDGRVRLARDTASIYVDPPRVRGVITILSVSLRLPLQEHPVLLASERRSATRHIVHGISVLRVILRDDRD
jgi:hypothetical protein